MTILIIKKRGVSKMNNNFVTSIMDDPNSLMLRTAKKVLANDSH